MIDVLGTVVGVKPEDDEGEGLKKCFEGRQQVMLADPLDTDDDLPLGDLIDGVDVIETLDAIEIALVDGVDAKKSGAAIRPGWAPHADLDRVAPGLVVMATQTLIADAVAQVVEMSIGGAPGAQSADRDRGCRRVRRACA